MKEAPLLCSFFVTLEVSHLAYLWIGGSVRINAGPIFRGDNRVLLGTFIEWRNCLVVDADVVN